MLESGETCETLGCGDFSIIQPQNGYRFSIDAYLLATFVDEKPGAHCLEIGSGSGVIAIMLAGMKGIKVTGVEVQPNLAAMSRRSVALNGLETEVEIITSDIKAYRAAPVSAVIANPPYRPLATGRLNPDNAKAVARHEIMLDLDTLLACTYTHLRRLGRFYCIYPTWRLADLFSAMRAHRLEPKRLRMVHSFPDSPAELCLVMGLKNGGCELRVEAPFTIYASEGIYSESMARVFTSLVF